MLDRNLTIQQASKSKNTYGEQVIVWNDYKNVPATIKENYRGVSNKEVYESSREASISELVFKVRYKKWLDPFNYRVKFEGRTYDINEVREDLDEYRRQYMLVIVDSRKADV